MNLQWLRHGNRTRAGMKGAGLVLAIWMISTGISAWAQVATRTQVSAAPGHQNGVTETVFTAKVGDVSGSTVTSGSVSFETANGSLGSALVENGVATLHVATLPPDTRNVTAVYHGDESHTSSSASVTANADATSALPDFSITASPTTLSLNPGDFGTVALTVTSLNGFADAVSLSCAGLPSASTCVFSPVNVTPASGQSVGSTLQVQTQAASGTNASLASPKSAPNGSRPVYAFVVPGMLALVGLGALRKRSGLAALRMVGFAALLAASGIGLTSCAARYNYFHKPPAANPGIAAGTYNITVAAYSSNGTSVTSHTLNLTMTIK